MRTIQSSLALLIGAFMLSQLPGCSTGSTVDMVKHEMGYERRDILVSDVKTARDAEDNAKDQFKTALQQFQAVTHFNGGDLEAEYNKLSAQYDACKSRAAKVSSQISRTQTASEKLFAEWQSELEQYSDQNLRAKSEQKLIETKSKFQTVLASMKAAESRMAPVLAHFNDQVLFIKHNLNAEAIASLKDTSAQIDSDVAGLIKDMEASIAEADKFINGLGKS
jgi:hypothetical protein